MLWRIGRGSLRNKIIVWSFVPAAIILVTVALVNLYAYQRVTENLVIERDRERTRLSASLLATELATYTDPPSGQFLSIFDGGMVALDAHGKVLAAEPEQIEAWGKDWTEGVSFRRMLQSSEPTFSDVLIDGRRGEKAIVVVVPIIGRQGEPVGGIAGLFLVGPATDSALYSSIEKLRRGESNCIYLVDSSGRVIYHSNPDYIGRDFSDQVVVQQVMNGRSGAFRTQDLDGHDIVASFAPVPDTSWGLVTEESWAALISPSRRYGQFLLLLLALGVVVPTLIVTVGVKRITQPIARLIGAAQEIAGGNFDQRITASTGDELEELARQFNLMAAQLQESYEHLEGKVADRTKELATLNTLATVVSRSLDLEKILNDALDEALGIMRMEKGQAFLMEEESQSLVLIAHRRLSDELVRYTAQLPLGASTSGLAAREGRPVVRKVVDYPGTKLKDLMQREGIQFVISTPLMAKGKTVGTIDLGAAALRTVDPEELSLLAAIGHQIGVAVENARLYEQAQQLAVIKERNRLARDLHDSVMQALYGVTMYAEAAARQLASGARDLTASYLHEIRDTAQESLREMRLLIFELRPPILRREGLVTALRARLEAVEERVGMQTEFKVDGCGPLSPEIEKDLYRVAQEALNNALKHAQASRVSVHLGQRDGIVTLEIADDGVGFDPSAARGKGGFGLRGMQERVTRLGGRLTVQSHPGKGTQIKVELCP
jgi:two-component system nitrate/nitrite sensor histidine kinase NarX